MNKATQISKKMDKLGKKLTLFITIPILAYMFLGTVGLIISIALLILVAISKKKTN